MNLTNVETRKRTDCALSLRPQFKTRVLVQCVRFRCLGYLDYDGKWRTAYGNEELPDVVGWEPL